MCVKPRWCDPNADKGRGGRGSGQVGGDEGRKKGILVMWWSITTEVLIILSSRETVKVQLIQCVECIYGHIRIHGMKNFLAKHK